MEAQDFIEWLKTEMKGRGWRPADLARAAGLHSGTFNRVFNQSRKAGPSVCVAIAQALEMDPVYVFRKAGLLPPAPASVLNPNREEILQLLAQLSKEDQETVIRILHGLVATKKESDDQQDK